MSMPFFVNFVCFVVQGLLCFALQDVLMLSAEACPPPVAAH